MPLFQTIQLKSIGIIFFGLMIVTSCKKLVEVNAPVTSINVDNVYTTDATAIAAVTGIYAKISDQSVSLTGNSISGISVFTSLSGDELELFGQSGSTLRPYYTNDLNPFVQTGLFWTTLYQIIFAANSALEGLQSSNSLTPIVKQQLLGEAKFMRAFCYFYLVNLYGDVPLAVGTDWKENASLSKVSQAEIYNQVVADLKDAEELLSENYLRADFLSNYPIQSAERIRPIKWAAKALLARTYLYLGNYADAEAQATQVINNTAFYKLNAPADAFLKNSTETIWAIPSVRAGVQANTSEGALFVLPPEGPNASDYPVYLSNRIVQAFEPNDLRVKAWVDSVKQGSTVYYYPKKYKVGKVNAATQEYSIVLRLSEVFLIRAEARAQQNKIPEGKDDLNAVRSRAGLGNTGATDKTSLVDAIMKERKVELFTEWGHRWLDLKRTKTIDPVMTVAATRKGGTWSSYKALYPIPQTEITLGHNLVQNDGYK
jgi:hypothetical protein